MRSTMITSGFWHDWLEINRSKSIFHQWEQLEASGCIDNFRILAENKPVFREGWFFADSDAYKWLDAASRIIGDHPDTHLLKMMDQFIRLIKAAQEPDGYLFTYNQILFPGTRWVNLQIEHELYCHGHLIEAGISHFKATGRSDLFDIVCLAADRITGDFLGKGCRYTPGHEEIEIALLKLFEVTSHLPYLQLAQQFIEQRGRDPWFGWHLMMQNQNVARRNHYVLQTKDSYMQEHPGVTINQLPPGNYAKKAPLALLQWMASALSGRLLQQHAPVSQQRTPEGHAVRFTYLETAVAIAARLSKNPASIALLEQLWERMVTRRMYVTGGIGSQPGIEGFGKDYELDPELAYCETCAALGSIFWNWEMAQLTNQARYSDLLEWQLYNASLVGMGVNGGSYLYNNPLASHGKITRKVWYAVPCCPSNLSRTLASLGEYIYSEHDDTIYIHQYINSHVNLRNLDISIRTNFPWDGKVSLTLHPAVSSSFKIALRHPAWSPNARIWINGHFYEEIALPQTSESTASGFDPRPAQWIILEQQWHKGDMIEIIFDMPVKIHCAHPRVKDHAGKMAISRGPILYCLESPDNPGVDIFTARVDPDTLREEPINFMGIDVIRLIGQTKDGESLYLIPYFLWANRGESQMCVWINAG